MFGIGMQELLIILVLVLIVFGAGKLPQVGEALGKGIRNFKAGLREENNRDDDGKKSSNDSSENQA
ncbi:MAG: twin-arginine translocase TatA/TatE family subunit [Deltaproteobacteria bacterium]|nr:twin-arginine translocase TatA/TatE family subunit [Deltaproteobacteria bacterium]